MGDDRWKKLKEMFDMARSLEQDARRDYLQHVIDHDPSIGKELTSLLQHGDSTKGPLNAPASISVAKCLQGSDQADPILGQVVGRYRVERRIGRGGFGDVYLGTRNADFNQEVAIKFLRSDLQTNNSVLRRFEIERQVLADLNHENIARLIDGGTTEQGRPYLVMDYVPRVTITQHCDANDLDIGQRLELFVQVGNAVAHAHRYGVIHRDLKPTNILVTRQGVAKLVDFGIVKLADLRSQTEMLTLTETGLRPLTPDYASPEQIRGEKVGLATDVYSLGVLLYELLTGARPYDVASRSASETERIVCHVQPLPPSSTINCRSAKSDSCDATANGHAHLINAHRLRREIRGDLDNIVLKALRKEPDRRYRSASELCDDIQRHQAGLPVLARADSFWYRVQSVVRRNRAAVLACLLVLLSLISGSVASYVGWYRAERSAERHREQLYVSDMQIAFDAFRHGQLDEVRRILERHSNVKDGVHGFEWQLLHRLSRPISALVLQGHDGPVNEIANVPGTRYLLSVGEDATIRVWDAATADLLNTFGPADGPLHAVAVSPDGKYFAAGSQTVTLWDLTQGRRVRDINSFTATVESLAFSPDGNQLAIGVRYQGATIVSVPDGRPIATKPGSSRYEKLFSSQTATC